MIRVALICDQVRLQQDILHPLRQEGYLILGTVDHDRDIWDRMRMWLPDVVIVVEPFGGSEVASLIQQLRAAFPDTAVIVAGKEIDVERTRRFFHQGVHDVLTLPKGIPNLPNAIRLATQNEWGREHGSRAGVVYAVWSPKGGVGCSLVAANVALALQTRQQKQTLLADLNGPFGNADGLLGLRPERTLADLFRVMSELGQQQLAQAVTSHETGLSVLCAPRLTAPLGGLLPEHIGPLGRVSRQRYEVTLWDLPCAWVESVDAALHEADRILLVVTPDAPCIRSMQEALYVLPTEKKEQMRVGVIVNRTSSRVELQCQEVERALSLPVIGSIPSAFTFIEPFINTGKPLVTAGGNRRREPAFIRELHRLAQRLA